VKEFFNRELTIAPLAARYQGLYRSVKVLAWVSAGFLLLVGLLLLVFSFTPGMRACISFGGSMRPAIRSGSIVAYSPSDAYMVGDIVAFEDVGGRGMVHRIVSLSEVEGREGFITKGDAYDYPDPNILTSDRIRGKVSLVLPYFAYFALTGFIIFAVIAGRQVQRLVSEVSSKRKRC
jgi:signal peptidase I